MAAACSGRFVLKSVRPGTVLFSPPTPASGSHCPSFPHRAHVAPSHSSCEWHSDLPTAWMLHVLAAGGLVPPIYFYIYALSLQLAASFPGAEGRVCGRVQAPPHVDHLGSHCGKCKNCCCCYCSRSLLPPKGQAEREQGMFQSESQYSGPAPSVTSSVTLDKPPNLSEPHIPHLIKMRTIPTSQGWCED